MSENPSVGLGARNQVIYASHSPYFVDLNHFDQLRMVRKVPSPNNEAFQSVVNQFSLTNIKDELEKITDKKYPNFTRESCLARTMPIMNTIVNEGFFADVVVVVEGESERGALWQLQEILKKNWASKEIVIVPAGGKNNIDRPVIIFRGLKINTYFIFDADSKHIGKKEEEKTKQTNKRLCLLADIIQTDFPDTQVLDNCAVFNNNLEVIYEESLGKEIFDKIKSEVAFELGYDEIERVTKNIEGSAKVIEKIYSKQYKIDVLEKIVDKVTNLASNS